MDFEVKIEVNTKLLSGGDIPEELDTALCEAAAAAIVTELNNEDFRHRIADRVNAVHASAGRRIGFRLHTITIVITDGQLVGCE